MDGGAAITGKKVCRRRVGEPVLRLDERYRPAQFPSLQGIVTQGPALPDFAYVVAASPTFFIVCGKARAPPIVLVHREEPEVARALRNAGDYRACRLHIPQIEIHRHRTVTQPGILRIERDGMLNDLDGFGQLAVDHINGLAVAVQRRYEVRIELQHLPQFSLTDPDATIV